MVRGYFLKLSISDAEIFPVVPKHHPSQRLLCWGLPGKASRDKESQVASEKHTNGDWFCQQDRGAKLPKGHVKQILPSAALP